MEFCEKLVRLRKSKHMTQDDLADALHISRQAVYKWECGQSYPEAMKLVALKELFDISIDLLLDPSYEVPAPIRSRARRAEKAAEKEQVASVATPLEVAPAVESQAEATPVLEEQDETSYSEPEKIEVPVFETPAPVDATEESTQQDAPSAPEADVRHEKRGFFARLFGRK